MYVEFYIDQFFAEHLLTGFLLIDLAVRIGRMDISKRRIALGSLIDTAFLTAGICTGTLWPGAAGLAAAGCAVFGKKGRGAVLRGTGLLLLVTVGFGGTLEALLSLTGLAALPAAVLAVLLLDAASRWREGQRLRAERLTRARLFFEGRTAEVDALIDTGNQLREPATGRPVSIVEKAAATELLGENWEQRRGCLLIPYHSLGTDCGWMKGVTIDRMTVMAGSQETAVLRPVLAFYPGDVSAAGTYRMILHPQHAAAGMKKGGE